MITTAFMSVPLGIAAALSAPVFQAIVPELVGKEALPDAIASYISTLPTELATVPQGKFR